MWNQTWCNFFGYLTNKTVIIGREILSSFLISHFEYTDRMVTQLYWHEEDITDYLV